MRLLTTICLWASLVSLWGQNNTYWIVYQEGARMPQAQYLMLGQLPSKYKLATLDVANLYQDWNAPYLTNSAAPMQVAVPNPEGGFTEFVITPTRVVADGVAHLYNIATFKGYAVDAPNRLIRCDISPAGFHAWVFGDGRSYMVEPLSKADPTLHIIYYKAEMPHTGVPCGVTDAHRKGEPMPADGAPKTPTQLRTYRLAVIADDSYRTQFGGMIYSPANVLAAFASGVNLLNGIYERDLGVHFTLVSNTACADAVLADHTDIDEVHDFLVNHSGLGVGGFDVGHSVLWENLGGLAYVGVVCNNMFKGGGYSALNTTVMGLWVDYVAHEVGHQFSADHTFAANECGTSVSSFRFEPGEGSSIMAYAGVCAAGYQSTSDPFLHAASIAQANSYIAGFGGCATLSMPGSGNSAAPVANANADITIPQQTPFILVGTGADANGDPITYSWQQYDGSGTATMGSPDCSSTTHPMFRFRLPVTDNFRIFPQYSDVLAGNNNTPAWEKLPCTPRTMNFRLTVRDNNINWGRTHADDVVVTVANTGPFNVTAPNGSENWPIGSSQNVTWTVNGTNGHCANVDILLSTDNGVTYTILGTYPNSGSATITVPATPTTQARILVQCSVGGNFRTASTFFDVSNAAFSISSAFGVGNIVLLQAESASANNTTANIIEINTFTPSQPAISNIPIDGTGPSALRFSGSATSTGYLANSDDRTLLLFTGHNNTSTSVNANTLNPRGVGTLNNAQTFNLATTYTGTSGNQTRCATTLNNTTMFIADQGGIYSNGTSSASPGGNFRGIKAFGGTVYVGQQSSTASNIQVSTVSAPVSGTITGLPGLSNSNTFQDFYLIQSGANGSTYDVLYTVYNTSATAGTIGKFSLVSGSWVANGTYTTTFGGFGLAAQKSGTGAELYVSTGNGATAGNSVIKLTDLAGYNTAINISTPSNVTLYTAPAGRTIKGVAFAPLPACPVLTSAPGEVIINNSTCGTGCTVGGGSIAPPTMGCPTGSTLQYSTDGGTTWSTTLPTYNQTGPAQNIRTRCICDTNPSITSPASTGVTTAPGSCPTLSAPTGMLAITNSTCQPGCTVGGGSIAIGTVTGTGGTLEFSQDGGTTWNSTLPAYNQTGPAQTIIARVTDANGCTSSSATVGTTAPGSCPTLSAPTGMLAITNSTCQPGCTVGGGSIAIGTVTGTGGTLEFSQDGGTTWNSTLPAYNQTGPAQTIIARVTDANGCTSGSATVGTTAPGACVNPEPPMLIITDNVCPSTTGTITATGCGAGTVAEYALAPGGPWSATPPAYTTSSFTVYARCRNTTTDCVSSTVSATTNPVACVTCPTLTTAPGEVVITNSTCGTGCTVGGGSIAPPTMGCPTGSTLQYSTDGGTTWSTTLPTYNQTGPAQNIRTRCVCDSDASVTSPASAGVTTAPGACSGPTAAVISGDGFFCSEGNTGNIPMIVVITGGTGPYTVVISEGMGTFTRTNYNSGDDIDRAVYSTTTYTLVSVTDANGCSVPMSGLSGTASMTQSPDNLDISEVLVHPTCADPSSGSISVTVTGGITPYYYLWSNAATTPTITGLMAGTYDLTVTDEGGCEAIASFDLDPPTCCPALTTAPGEVVITNSTCGTGCTVGGGSIAPPTMGCPTGSTLQYSTDGGTTWSTTLPTYNQTGPAQNIRTRCVCDSDASVTSPASAGVTTAPGSCPTLSAPTGALAITNSTCQSGCTVGGGSIAIGTVTGTGGMLEFSQDGGTTWSATLPTYNQTGPAQSIITRVTDANGCTSSSATVGTTAPGACVNPEPPMLIITDNVCPSTTGTITATGCGAGTVTEYALAPGGPWSATPPAYTTSSFTVYARCRNTTTDCVSSTVSATTNPITCPCGSAYWNMTSEPVTTNTIPNVAASDIGRGNNNGTTTLITTASASTGYTGASGGGNAGAAAFIGPLNTSTSTYFQVVITPNPGFVFTLNSISFGMRSTSTGPQAYSIRTSLDGYATEVAGNTVPNNSVWNLYSHTSLSVASAAGVPITIRIYGYNGTGSPTAGTANWRIDDLTISGCTTNACPALTTAPGEVVVTNSTCNPGCSTSGGSIAPPTTTCPSGSTLQYSVNGGPWSATLPTYNQTGPAQTIQTRCACNADPNVTSPASTGVTTVPGTCPTPTLTGTSPVCIGDDMQLTGSGTPASIDPYVSSNTTVATVTNTGLVTGISAGMSIITYTDNNGCKATFNVTVINCAPVCDVAITSLTSTAPSCPGGSNGTLTITATTSNPALTYAIAGPATGSNATGAFTGLPAGMYSITVTDGIGCTQTTTFSVPAGTDTTPPDITCPSDQTQNVNAGTCTWASPAGSLTPTTSDNCPVASVTWTATFPGPAPDVTIAGWNFENATKRSGGLPYTADTGIPANQNIAPLSNVGANFTTYVQGSGGSGTFAPNADNWTGASDKYWQVLISTTGYNTLRVSSAMAGSNTGPRDFTVDYSLDGSSWTNVPSSNVTVGPTPAPTFTGFLVNVALPAACNNQPTLYLRWRRVGTTAVNGTSIATGGTNRIDDIVVIGKPLATGVNDISGTVFPVGTTSVTYTVTDGSGNTNTCTFMVTVNDNIAPALTCPATQTLPLSGSSCNATLPNYTTLATANDNCSTVTLTQSPPAGTTVSGVGPMTVTITATDGAGNTATCTFTVNKTAPAPTITCPANQILALGASCSATLPNYTGLVTATGCGTVTVTQSPAAGTTVSGAGPMTVTFTATDGGGNTAQCSITVNKVDTTPPTVTCNNTTITFNGEPSITLSATALVTATDNCGIASITLSPSVINCNQVGQVVPVTVTVTDVNSNVSTCTANVTVGGFPCGWSYTPGLIACDGAASYNPGTGVWTNTAVNCFYPNSYDSDSKSFIMRPLCGNGSITVQVTSISPLASGWAGIVMRDGTAPGAKKIQLMTNLSNFHRREVRYVTNGTAYPQQFPANFRYWLRLVRQGNQFTGFVSPDGVAWFFAMAAIIDMPNCIDMGLVVTNYTPISTVTATFANVSTTGSLTPLMAPAVTEERLSGFTPEFDLYPNPTNGQLNLDLKEYLGRAVRIEVYSLEGKLVQFSEVDAVQTPIETFEMKARTSGMYLVKVKSAGLPDAVRRVVLNR